MPAIEFSEVAARLSAERFARHEMDMRGNRAKCPWCDNPRRYNLKFLDDGHCYCHSCHKSGEVVTLAAAVWHTNQREAAVMLNDEYSLGLTAQMPSENRRQQMNARQLERDQRRKEAARALSDAQKEAAQAWLIVNGFNAIDKDTPAYMDALKRAKNADVWVRFKRIEAQQAAAI